MVSRRGCGAVRSSLKRRLCQGWVTEKYCVTVSIPGEMEKDVKVQAFILTLPDTDQQRCQSSSRERQRGASEAPSQKCVGR
ncbi:hypothetical protein DPEC_G00124900 [Dallia pectoralis]|uniref:Uncharacterized protein n=1 Tax=Dallia pectoralis TaxID=75939 RepID=A0ACC2GRR2_DALPE|nr:hypothetical protein DPEC_G00124900 [Dallia pectoralis]